LSASFLVPAADPKAGYLSHKEEIDQAILRALEAGTYILGNEVAAFEKEFADYLGVGSAIGVGNGTDALHLALRACNIGRGDIVITVSHTAVATVAAIELAGARPLLVDIDSASLTIDPQRVEDAIRQYQESREKSDGGRLKAIVPVHLYGQSCDMASIADIAKRHDLTIIEDCAQSLGAATDGRTTGTWGDIASFSFYPTKNLGALGDGGAVVTNDAALATKARELREYGWRQRYISEARGMNTRLDELQAAILRIKLRYLDEENSQRRRIARQYSNALSTADLILPVSRDHETHAYHQYVVRSKLRDDLRAFLKTNSVGTLIHYPVPVHLQPAYHSRVMIGYGGLENTERVCQEILSLPIYPQISEGHIRIVTDLISRWQPQTQV